MTPRYLVRMDKEIEMCLSPEMFCCGCLMESFGQLLRYPLEEVEEGLRLCSKHKREYLANRGSVECCCCSGEYALANPAKADVH